MRKILLILAIALLFNVAGCLVAPAPTDPEPKKLFDFPDWITSPQLIETYLQSVNAEYTSDEVLTGYDNYYFTPAETVMKAIPDAKNKDRIIYKPEWEGDCDDWAIMTAYLAQEALGWEAHYVAIFPHLNLGTPGHAISYAIAPDGKVHVWDLWYYRKSYDKFEDYLKKYYPDMVVRKDLPIWDWIYELVHKGHVLYYTDKYEKKAKSHRDEDECSGGYCVVNWRIVWGVNYFKY